MDAESPEPEPSLEFPKKVTSVRAVDKPETMFPEIDAAMSIVDVDARPLDRRPTALNPWNAKTPGLGAETAAALEALKDVRRPTAVVEPANGRRWLFLLTAVVLTFGTIVVVALLKSRGAFDGTTPAVPAPLAELAPAVKLPAIPAALRDSDSATKVASRQEMVAAFDRHDFAEGIRIGEELEKAGALDVDAELWLADACRHSNRLVEALKRYEDFVTAHPEDPRLDAAHYQAAEVARGVGKLDIAWGHYQAVVADEKSSLWGKAKKRLATLK